MRTTILCTAASIICTLSSCVKESFDDSPVLLTSEEVSELTTDELQIPRGFDYSTTQMVAVQINDLSDNAIYEIYARNKADEEPSTTTNEFGEVIQTQQNPTDLYDRLLFKGSPVNGTIEHVITLPAYHTDVYVKRKDNGIYSSSIADIVGGNISYSHKGALTGKSSQNTTIEYILGSNGGSIVQVNTVDGTATVVTTPPMSTFALCIDNVNKILYAISNTNETLMRYDIENDSWTIVTTLPTLSAIFRMAYLQSEQVLYVSTGELIYKMDPATGNVLSTHDIFGLDRTNGGDFALAADGTLYICTHQSVYRLDEDGNGDFQATLLNSTPMPFAVLAITFDTNGVFWVAGKNSNDQYEVTNMDPVTGNFTYIYGESANNGTDFNTVVGDLDTYTYVPAPADDDNDGVPNDDDDFPIDPVRAFISYYPNQTDNSTLSFEDLWPSEGDYDFNDATINYQITSILNAQNEVVEMDIDLEVVSHGASFTNAVGMEFENITSSQIASVTGTKLVENYIQLNANGTEAGQANAVVILYDNNLERLNKPFTVSISFTNPIPSTQLGSAPYNPFLIADNIRANEVHLPYESATSLGADQSTNYVTDGGLPFAIHLVDEFAVPKEKVSINDAYNFFNQWATSGGSSYPNWYLDNPGYRNSENIQ